MVPKIAMTHETGAARLVTVTTLRPDQGLAWRGALPPGSEAAFSLRLFEDGIELGPRHSLHRDIRELGGGRFSWYRGGLWFSTSDHADPRLNGRTYMALLSAPGAEASLIAAVEETGTLSPDTPETTRHALLNRFRHLAYPAFSLPDFGRRIDADSEFKSAMARFFGDRAEPVVVDRRYALKELAKLAMGLDGNIAECGCYTGASAYVVADTVRRADAAKSLHLFDSFAGLPAPGAVDGRHWRAGDLASPLETARANLADFPFVHFHPGWIPETFAAVDDLGFALVHIDVDLYEPTRDSLRFFWDRLVPRGLLVCDDYGFTTCPGATRAIDDFFANRPEPIVNLSSGGALIVKTG